MDIPHILKMLDEDVLESRKHTQRATRDLVSLSVAAWSVGREIEELAELIGEKDWWVKQMIDKYAVAEARGWFDSPTKRGFITGIRLRFLHAKYIDEIDRDILLQSRNKFLGQGQTAAVSYRMGFYYACELSEILEGCDGQGEDEDRS